MLIAGRLVQGGFGALLIPQGIGILLGTFSREQLPRVFSAFGPVMGASAGGHDRLLQPAGPARRRARHDRERRRRRRDRRPVPRPRLAAPQVSPKEQH